LYPYDNNGLKWLKIQKTDIGLVRYAGYITSSGLVQYTGQCADLHEQKSLVTNTRVVNTIHGGGEKYLREI